MYTVMDFGRMAGDPVRMDAYRRAIDAAVRPGAVVLDLGAGTGVMSILALRAGAARVHAVDPNPAVWLVPDVARDNGFAERVVVHQTSSLEMSVPEPIDVVVSDMRGPSPLLDDNLAAVHDVCRRWLAPGGVVIPNRDTLKVTLVEGADIHRRIEDSVEAFERLGIAARTLRQISRQQILRDQGFPLHASDVLSTAATWATIEYSAIRLESFEGHVELHVTRGGVARGLATYFDTELMPGIGFTTAPGQAIVYGRFFLPLLEPITVAPGDVIRATIRSDVTGERMAWDTTVLRDGRPLASYRQATFLGEPGSMVTLARGADRSAPVVSAHGARLAKILLAMDGTKTVREIAESASGDGPGEGLERTLEIVRGLAVRYGG